MGVWGQCQGVEAKGGVWVHLVGDGDGRQVDNLPELDGRRSAAGDRHVVGEHAQAGRRLGCRPFVSPTWRRAASRGAPWRCPWRAACPSAAQSPRGTGTP